MIAINQRIYLPQLEDKNIEISMKRLDLIDSAAAGNKYFKLKYNLERASSVGYDTLLTFGGAFSNHIWATARAGKQAGFRTIGVIRGDELANTWKSNPSLNQAHNAGMRFKFVSRSQYRLKDEQEFLSSLKDEFGAFYLLPEGGTNDLAVKGCAEILDEQDSRFDLICCSVGTGGTLAGLGHSLMNNQSLLGFSALKAEGLKEDIRKFTGGIKWDLSMEYVFGGYAKVSKELVAFINEFKSSTGIPLDPVYTGKMMFGIVDMAMEGRFKTGTSILAIHSGGLQGIDGMNLVLKKKKLPLICV